MFKNPHYKYLLAVVIPLPVSLLAIFPREIIPADNVALVFIIAVILTAVNTGTRPAMLSAFVSFITFNFFFTEPLHSLLVLNPQDALTISLFALTALLVGHLAARLRERVEQLQIREHFSKIELVFMERLAAAIDSNHVLMALEEALRSFSGLGFKLSRVTASDVALAGTDVIRKNSEIYTTRLLTDGQEQVALLHTLENSGPPDQKDSIQLLVHQTNLALGRTRLARDLQRERNGKEQEALRSSLLSSVSHDFRTPLTAMIGAASTLQEMGELLSPPDQRELLDSILSEAIRLDGYTQKLLDMTRLGYGELKLNRSTISLEEILNVVNKRFRHDGKQQRIKLELAPSLPLLNVHAALIEQALYNVIENSLKFSAPDELVVVRGSIREGEMVIEVEDNGPGIPVLEREKVFEMFHSADRGDRRVAGSGLGLAICKGMIGAHGGRVQILDTARNTGCIVEIRMPLAHAGEQQS